MQMLEIIKKLQLIVWAYLFFIGKVHALPLADGAGTCNPNGVTNSEIITCANIRYAMIDSILNAQYKELKSGLNDSSLQNQLVDAQRAWVKFRDKSCSDAYESEAPGAEAPIVKLACLGELTSVRVGELIYLRTGYMSDGFANAVSAVARPMGVDAASRAQALKVLEGAASYGSLFDEYAGKNCAMAGKLHFEVESMCVSRIKFNNSAR